MYIEGIGWVPDQVLGGIGGLAAEPPQYIQNELARIGTPWDPAKYGWDPLSMSLIDKATGSKYSYANIADPSLGTNVVLPYGYSGGDLGYGGGGTNLGVTLPGFGDTYHFEEGQNPYIAFPEGNGIFVSSDPGAIDEYQHDAQTRVLQGVAQVGALVGGGALAGSYFNTPTAAGAAADGLSPITVTTPTLAGGVPSVEAAAAGAWGGAPLASLPAAISTPEAISAFTGAGVPALTSGTGSATTTASDVAAGATGAGGAAGGATNAANDLLNSPWLTGLTIGSSLLGAALGDKAADAQLAAAKEAIAESRRQYDTTRGDALPVIQLGQQSADQLKRYLGGDRSVFQESAGRAYLLGEGQKAIDRYAASRGMFNSGAAGKELLRHATGLADQTENEFVNRLLASAGLGTTGTSVSANAGANSAANVSNALQYGANSRASGYGAINNALQGGIENELLRRYLRAA